jgi:hypothetical protein
MQGGSNRFVCKTIYLKLNNAEYNPKLEVSNLMKLCSVSVSATKNDSSNRHKNVAATKLVHSLDLIAAADDEAAEAGSICLACPNRQRAGLRF